MSIVKINALTVSPEMRETLEKRFAARAGSVENSDGFEWFELLRPVDGTDQYLVYTRWRSEEDFTKWMATSMRGPGAHGAGQGGQGAGGSAGGGAGASEGGAERPKPAASDSALWSFEVIQQTAPKS
ncbi:antibiotic biosynthesis monooxygenase [Streptomyces sp. SPB162]|uniref:antibiotic biosynthesis monooxygenase family protein n=1 Tax=Streptomyces sp. SPB162 TaxID=2940560 RepID=UPI002407110B|nr:antibiotic biosynthesis monooxygenase [Streptomyces sp. SPB162]MDF9812902.1 heme-degrading monooxygenase HmoA [Streptomyces sp. SPB162]